eukprot:SAG31_NODE_253_length_19063_cov_31.913362_2_plen_43_part_00
MNDKNEAVAEETAVVMPMPTRGTANIVEIPDGTHATADNMPQ